MEDMTTPDKEHERLVFTPFLPGRIKEVMFFGGVPGLMMDHHKTGGQSVDNGDKRLRYIAEFNKEAQADRDQHLKEMLSLLYSNSNSANSVPKPLLPLMDMRPGRVSQEMVICWVPFYLYLVLHYGQWGSAEAKKFSAAVLHLMKRFMTEMNEWDAFFVIFLLARSVNGDSDDYFLPADLFAKKPLVDFYSEMGDCKTWEEFEAALQARTGSDAPTLAIVYPESNLLEADTIVVYLEDKKIIRCVAVHFDPGNRFTEADCPMYGFEKRIGISMRSSAETKPGNITFASEQAIQQFYGESGDMWSPFSYQRIFKSAFGK
jgi:hypothetical protein